jgi:hypothetical protein
MGWMDQLSNVLQQYHGASAEAPPQNTEQDFSRVSQGAPPSAISGGLADAFRSNQTPPFAQMVSQLFGQSNGQQRAGILNQLVGAAGPAALSGGLLSGLAGMLHGGSSITPEQAQQVSPEAVQRLAEHAERQDPSIVDKASEFYSQHPTLVQGLGAGALALIMSKMYQNH